MKNKGKRMRAYHLQKMKRKENEKETNEEVDENATEEQPVDEIE